MDQQPRQKTFSTIMLLVAALVIVAIGGVFRDRIFSSSSDVFTVSADATIDATPDIGNITFSVQIFNQETQEQAADANSEKMNAVIQVIKDRGIAVADIQTSQYSIYPVYAYDTKTGEQSITGYTASQSVRVKIRDVAATGAVIAAAVEAGANQTSGLQFGIDDDEALLRQARQEAIINAKKKALEISSEAGIRLGKLIDVDVVEVDGMPPYPLYDTAAVALEDDVAEPDIVTGTQKVTVRVTLMYKVK